VRWRPLNKRTVLVLPPPEVAGWERQKTILTCFPLFIGKDKKLTFIAWAASAKYCMNLKGGTAIEHVASAAS